MDHTLKASLAELAHVKIEDLRGVLPPPRQSFSLRRLLPAGAGVLLAAAAMVVAYRWRTWS